MSMMYQVTAEIQRRMEKFCGIAIENTCQILLGVLQDYIMSEYYDKYDPEYYNRTYQFWKSAVTKMVKANCGQIFMNKDAMDYNDYWDGETQLYMADAGFHGSVDIYRKGHFFKKFISYCEDHAIDILKSELKKQKIKVK